MALHYQAVSWNRQKTLYDWAIAGFVGLYLLIFCGLQAILFPDVTAETVIIRATSTLAFLMLHVILMIGPLCRLNPRFLPLLYNRRHLGVSMFLISAVHSVFSLLQFHSRGNVGMLKSLFTSEPDYRHFSQFPFQTLGFFALLILLVMAATSHDFWLKNLTPRLWKTLHMGVYVVYGLIVMHVLLGVLQQETSSLYVILLACGVVTIVGLHLAAAFVSHQPNQPAPKTGTDGFVSVCDVNDIHENRAKTMLINGQNIAIFRYDGKVSAVNNQCRHQNGPLGEGKIIDGCITCPWHGYQYQPQNGQSPPPFTEKVETYAVKCIGTTIWVNPTPSLPGTPQTTAFF
ncbi:Rieske 2Fe-2S domain-containing protein [Dyadobacter arcticus]|uniref:Nitrite reductase/ring-hydroxylating ferredoxin subunit/DMSO/TMAO reductase YedYZ heme-binding membrane subunit n=1 Tax=Dyadobacter arcticus TaxID=1078754 RepID=A0ABX0UH22_9BACT|nr:Rieske 2Fe-2S domain-containing protein [Dyadobacter arcticus]NIJ52271.1 nitrite reductase/ring-hydroxylating ferredoxin subunit/DMSO/TMAO reductase YedYZ heme-binding membrane subunit [Dyadobacter arcticus]